MKKFILVAAALAAPASAHIVFAPAEATAGSYYAGEFRVGHGCGDAATRAVRIEIPEGIMTARPRPKPGWSVAIERAPLATPILSEGREQRDRVAAITWRGNLPSDQFDGFGLMLKLPADRSGPLYLPVRQTCGDETVVWSEVAAAGHTGSPLKHPAPTLTVHPARSGHVH